MEIAVFFGVASDLYLTYFETAHAIYEPYIADALQDRNNSLKD